jgi:hypothetical protein
MTIYYTPKKKSLRQCTNIDFIFFKWYIPIYVGLVTPINIDLHIKLLIFFFFGTMEYSTFETMEIVIIFSI